ncbi:MAG TPA: metallophosphoesterase [Bacteroidales bacterium]|nr:metallophosphoesterase [Bacteroidales bacterium]
MSHLFAISDIHGCYKPFYKLVTDTINLKKSDQLILLGDYIDRGAQSKEVIDFILDLRKGGYDVTALAGNHEVLLLDSYHKPEIFPLWLANGGAITLESFGITDIQDIDKLYLDFFTGLDFYKIIRNNVFVHAGFDDFAINPFDEKHSMIWECRYAYHHPALSGKTIIHGHRPKTLPTVTKILSEKPRIIPIDTGCVYEKEIGFGMLTALEVNSMQLFSVPNQ